MNLRVIFDLDKTIQGYVVQICSKCEKDNYEIGFTAGLRAASQIITDTVNKDKQKDES